MAVLNKCLVLAFAALSVARPLAVRDVAMVTETSFTYVDVPVTVWVDEQGHTISTEGPAGVVAQSTTPVAPVAQHTVIPSSSPVPQAQAVQTTAQAPSPRPVTTTSIYVAPTPAQTYAATTPAAVYTTTPVAAAPVQSSAAPAANSGSSGSTGKVTSSSTASCLGEGNACMGDITHWDGGLGACGWNVNTASDMQIALPYGFMGTQSNGNPYCGKSLTIQNPNTGATVQATVGDKCMGCEGRSIDMTDALFNAIGGGCDGRCHGFSWWFN